jgi:hypothetical protein
MSPNVSIGGGSPDDFSGETMGFYNHTTSTSAERELGDTIYAISSPLRRIEV